METWQRRVIEKNLPDLIKITLCNKTLLALLSAEDLLSEEENNQIDATPNPTHKADYLYKVLLTRKNAYQLHMNACKQSKQTGVVGILEDGEKEHNLAVEKHSQINPQNVASTSTSQTTKTVLPKATYSEITKTQRATSLATHNETAMRNLPFPLQVNQASQASSENPDTLSYFESQASMISINQQDDQGRTVLHRALIEGQSLSHIKSLINQGAQWKIKDDAREGVLHFAVRGGNKEVIIFLMSLKSDINEVDELGETPLHKVRFTKNGDYLRMTTFLQDIGANLLAENRYGNNVAHLFPIAENMSTDDFKIWVKGMIANGNGRIFGVLGFYGRTPLQSAMQTLDLDLGTIKLLLKSPNVDINRQDENGDTLLLLALSFGRSLETIKSILQLSPNTKMKNKIGNGVEHQAVIGGNKEVVLHLMSLSYNFLRKNKLGYTPMISVTETRLKNFYELTEILWDYGATLYCDNNNSNTLAHLLPLRPNVTCDDFKIWASSMIEDGHGHVFALQGDLGRTPLHFAMQRLDLDLETIQLIVQSVKLDINQPDSEGSTILHMALDFGRSCDTVKNLIELGADWNMKGGHGRGVMHFAVTGSNKGSFLFLKFLGADVNATDKDGRTPLHYVRNTKSEDFVGMTKLLLENGANLKAKDRYGETVKQMFSRESSKKYRAWKQGMIQLGYTSLFNNKSVFSRLLSSN